MDIDCHMMLPSKLSAVRASSVHWLEDSDSEEEINAQVIEHARNMHHAGHAGARLPSARRVAAAHL